MEKLQIHYGVQGDGMTFGLRPRIYNALKEMFPDARPPKSIFVVYDWRLDFENYHANLEKYIFPALMGFVNDQDLKQFKTIEFIKTPEKTVTYIIEQNQNVQYEQHTELVPG